MKSATRKKTSSKAGPKQLTVIRLPMDVRQKLAARAQAEQRSLSNAAVACITERLLALEAAA